MWGRAVVCPREQFLRSLHRRGKIHHARVRRLRSWTHSGIALNAERRIPTGARNELERQLTYMKCLPHSLERLTLLADGRVHYQGTSFHPGLGCDHQLLPGLKFLALFNLYVALRYEVTIRTYRAVSTSRRKRLGWIDRRPGARPRPLQAADVRKVEHDQRKIETPNANPTAPLSEPSRLDAPGWRRGFVGQRRLHATLRRANGPPRQSLATPAGQATLRHRSQRPSLPPRAHTEPGPTPQSHRPAPSVPTLPDTLPLARFPLIVSGVPMMRIRPSSRPMPTTATSWATRERA